jgi:hypothetical protein
MVNGRAKGDRVKGTSCVCRVTEVLLGSRTKPKRGGTLSPTWGGSFGLQLEETEECRSVVATFVAAWSKVQERIRADLTDTSAGMVWSDVVAKVHRQKMTV